MTDVVDSPARVTIAATIPVAQYANIQPSFDVEAPTHDEAMEIGLQRLKEIWDRTAQKPLDINRGGEDLPPGKILRCKVSGTEVHFDPVAHVYRSSDGSRWLGGSTFASRFKAPFAGDIIAAKMAEKYGVDADEIRAMWALNAEASSTFGTSVHAALQLRGEYADLSRAVKDGGLDSALTSNPVLRPIVEAFFEDHGDEKAFYEAFVANGREKACGLIDRLVVDDDGLWVEDFKTSATLDKPETILAPFKGVVPNTSLGAFWLQLSFYARILAAHGRVVKGLRVHHWTGQEWQTHSSPVIDLDPAFAA